MLFATGAERIETLARSGPISRTKIYAAISDGELVAKKFGRATLILKEDWERFLHTRPAAERRAVRVRQHNAA